jgi:mono/diheme cytochrome c family protein
MPSSAWQLDDAQVAALATYIRNDWPSGAAAAVTADTVRKQRKDLQARTD